ncbi:MAG: hypothetical protein WEB88_00115 [Gemmatimonadota bacterium]
MPRCTPLHVALALAVLAAPVSAQQAPVDVASLAPRSLVYSMSAMGNHIMDSTREIVREEVDGVDAVVVRSAGESGMISSTSDLAVSVADFRPIHFNLEMSQGGMGLTQRLRAADGRITGSMEAGGQQIEVLLRQEAPHILLKQTVPAQGMSVELKEIRNQD